MRDQQAHRGDIGGLGRAPERRRLAAGEGIGFRIGSQFAATSRRAGVGIGAVRQQRLHQFQLALLGRNPNPGGPLGVGLRIRHCPTRFALASRPVQRRVSRAVGIRIGAHLEESLREIHVAAERGDQ